MTNKPFPKYARQVTNHLPVFVRRAVNRFIANPWNCIVFFGWVCVLGLSLFHRSADYWFSVDRVFVFDSIEGTTPKMEVTRTIKRPFRGTWITEINKKGDNGFFVFCSATGTNNYKPHDALPDPVDLNFWTWPTRCELPPGEYQLDTTWTIRPTDFSPREVSIASNIFFVAPRK